MTTHDGDVKGLTPSLKVDPSSAQIDSTAVFVLSPFTRLINEHEFVKAYTMSAEGPLRLHHTSGVMMTLFDGKKSIYDIACAAAFLSKEASPEKAMKDALSRVVSLVRLCRQTSQEGQDTGGNEAAKRTAIMRKPLLTPEEMKLFDNVDRPTYNPKQMIPQYSYGQHRTEAGKQRAPDIINWHLTSKCSTDCRYCYLGRRNIKNSDALSKERALALLKEAQALGIPNITPTGGDVLLCDWLEDFLGTLKQYGMLPVYLATKSYLSKNMARKLAALRFIVELQFSIDSHVESISDWMVQSPGYYKRIMESIENALAAGLRVSTKSVITPYNILTIPGMYNHFRRMGVSECRLATYCRSGYHHTDDLYNHSESMDWLMQECATLGKEWPQDFINIQNGPVAATPPLPDDLAKNWPPKIACSAGRSAMMICSDGKVIPCEQMPEIDAFFCGDLKEQSIEEVWNGEKFAALTTGMNKEQFRGTICFDCESLDVCIRRGNCIRDVAKFHGSVYLPPSNCPQCNLPFVRIQ